MILYILRSDAIYVSFSGMAAQTIIDMLAAQGLTCTFISQTEYQDATKGVPR